jgi:hypothetical protein
MQTYFIEKPTYKTTEFKIRFDTPQEKKIPCKVIDEKAGKTFISYDTGTGETMKWVDTNQIIEE